MPRFVLFALVLLLVPGISLAGFNLSYQHTGTINMDIAGAAGGNFQTVSGNLTISGMPPTATVLHAMLYATQSNNIAGLDAIFAGIGQGSVGPIATDAGAPSLSTYAWNVTLHVVPGVNTYSYTIGQLAGGVNGVAGVALVVVWSDPLESTRTIMIQDGMQQVGESGAETENMTFNLTTGGPTKAWVFTVYDDAPTADENVLYNTNVIGGPLVANHGFNASTLSMNTTSLAGNNTLGIQTFSDHLGWVIGAIVVDPPPVPVEETSWGRIKAKHLSP